CQQYSSLVAF
nr:immunoglobulin light chain junction region [Macaca mulatta]MOV81494.1 immunoglobulin light chain junction region [Macaca mulatta]MOV84746.1 immunoglobulin light chain junction region [Macaca mulatta]MOV85875.1 immunoglobulin light chain junction region [Macaca mulatta]